MEPIKHELEVGIEISNLSVEMKAEDLENATEVIKEFNYEELDLQYYYHKKLLAYIIMKGKPFNLQK